MVFFVLLLKLLSFMILAMEIVWFIGFWCYGMSFAIYLSSFMKDSLEDDMENLLLVFGLNKACWFLVWFFFFCLAMLVSKDECSWQEVLVLPVSSIVCVIRKIVKVE